MDIFSERIKPLFEKSGKLDTELEREIGIPPKKINQWTSGYTKSWQKYIPQIASYFHVSTDYLLGRTDDPRPIGESEQPAPITESRPQYPPEYDMLTPANKAIVDRLIADLAKSQSPE